MKQKPRSMRELEALPLEEAVSYWESLTDKEKLKLANAMTPEEIAAMPEEVTRHMREMKADTLERALGELEAAQATDGSFHYTGDGDSFELTEDYCQKRLADLTSKFEGETEESVGFYPYHNMRIWIESYTLLLNEYAKRKEGK